MRHACVLLVIACGACGGGSLPASSQTNQDARCSSTDYLFEGVSCDAAQSGLSCPSGDGTCACDGSFWHCRSPDCPAEFPASGTCQSYYGVCDYGGGRGCTCVYPEERWLCCDGAPEHCPSAQPVEGALCCGGVPIAETPCGYGCGGAASVTCSCDDNHWHCAQDRCPL